jgi:hypothetical protein
MVLYAACILHKMYICRFPVNGDVVTALLRERERERERER